MPRCVLAASWAQDSGDVNVHSFGEQEFAPAGFVQEKKKGSAERLAKVNSEGEQLAAGGGESPFWDGVSGSCWP